MIEFASEAERDAWVRFAAGAATFNVANAVHNADYLLAEYRKRMEAPALPAPEPPMPRETTITIHALEPGSEVGRRIARAIEEAQRRGVIAT